MKEIERSIDALENVAGYEFVKDDIISLEEKLEERRREKSLLKQKLGRTKLIADGRRVDSQEVGEFFEQMSAGLGDLIKKDLEEVYTDILQMTSKFAEIIPAFHRQENCIPFAAIG